MRTCAALLVAIVLCVAAAAAQDIPAARPANDVSPSKEIADLKRQVNELLDVIATVRAQRADCEATLGPLEAKARQQDSYERWAALKTWLEKENPGHDCNPRTLECTKRPEPPKSSGGSSKK